MDGTGTIEATLADRFAPHAALADELLPHALSEAHDGAHDAAHLVRVWNNARRIAAIEGGDLELLAAATLMHDCVAVPKSSPERSRASRMSAVRASVSLHARGWAVSRVEAVAHCIEAHSFSAGIEPRSLEASILQDADRLDALGAIGVARCFMVSGSMGRPLYDPEDPAAERRDVDDVAWTLDHFPAKLLRLAGSFRTAEGRRLARERHDRLARFHAEMLEEIG